MLEKGLTNLLQNLGISDKNFDQQDDLISEFSNLGEFCDKVIASHYHNREDGTEEWIYFQDPSLLMHGSHKPRKVSSDAWKSRKSVYIAPEDVVTKKSSILEPVSQMELRKKEDTAAKRILKRTSIAFANFNEPKVSEEEEFQKLIPDNQLWQPHEFQQYADQHYQQRKMQLASLKGRRRSTIMRK